MAEPWANVIAKPEFQQLSPQEKYQAQIQYFNEVVRPQVDQKNLGNARNAFFSEFKPEIYNVDPTAGMSGPEKFWSGAGKAVYDMGRGAGQMLGVVSNEDISESRKRDAPLMNTKAGIAGNIGGNIAAAIPATFIPGANTAVGATLIGSTMGALQPTSENESRLRNTVTGGLLGVGGYGVGKGLGKVGQWASNKSAAIESKVAAKAAEQAAADTASARSAAGNAAQNAYRQLEHLRELKAMGALSPEQAQIAASLEKELANKAMEKLIPSAALKASTADAYREAIQSESTRAAQLAAEKLSGAEAKRQVMARLLRYGPAAVGGMVGNMIFPGLGGSVGGAATGLVLRPALHSMIRLAKNPAVQHALLSPVANSTILASPSLPRALGLSAPAFGMSMSDPSRLAAMLRNSSFPPEQQ